jgi:hypothetical protein
MDLVLWHHNQIILERYAKALINQKAVGSVGLVIGRSHNPKQNNQNQGYTPGACEVIAASLWPNHYILDAKTRR